MTAPNSHYLRRTAGAESAIGKRKEPGGARRWKMTSEARKQPFLRHRTSLIKPQTVFFLSCATLYENDLPSLCRSPVRERGEKGAIRRSKGNRRTAGPLRKSFERISFAFHVLLLLTTAAALTAGYRRWRGRPSICMHKETTAVEQETARSKNKTTSPNMLLSGLV